ncbi:MAG: hypothetical protein ABSF52_14010 [Syntrophobacteraceae bacterium]
MRKRPIAVGAGLALDRGRGAKCGLHAPRGEFFDRICGDQGLTCPETLGRQGGLQGEVVPTGANHWLNRFGLQAEGIPRTPKADDFRLTAVRGSSA